VAYLAGEETLKGRDDGLMQPVTLEFTLDGVDEQKGIICIGDVDDVKLNGERFLDYCKRCTQEPSGRRAPSSYRPSRPKTGKYHSGKRGGHHKGGGDFFRGFTA
jgi:hypothetical protein